MNNASLGLFLDELEDMSICMFPYACFSPKLLCYNCLMTFDDMRNVLYNVHGGHREKGN